MTAVYRITLEVDPSQPVWLEDIDLPLLLSHGSDTKSEFVDWLAVHDLRNRALTLQSLDAARASAFCGQRCRSLVLDFGGPAAPGARPVDIYVGTGAVERKPAVMRIDLGLDEAGFDDRASVERFIKDRLPGLFGLLVGSAAAADEVKIKETPDVLEASVSDQPFFHYHYNTKGPEVRRPIFHPVHGPTGKVITQLGEVPGKKVAHFHHTALWIAHQNWTAKGYPNLDNWQLNKNCTRIEHVKFDKIESGPLAARFIEQLGWMDPKNAKVLVAETRTVTVPKRPAASRAIDIDIILKAQDLPVTLNRTPYHLLACRVLDALLPKNGGAMTNSDGKKNPPDGAPANWIDISGKLNGEEQGVALFNHPKNERQPTPCLQFGGQTIGLSPTHKEPLTIEPGKEVRFRFRALVHAGNVETGKIAAEYEAYGKGGQGKICGVERLVV